MAIYATDDLEVKLRAQIASLTARYNDHTKQARRAMNRSGEKFRKIRAMTGLQYKERNDRILKLELQLDSIIFAKASSPDVRISIEIMCHAIASFR